MKRMFGRDFCRCATVDTAAVPAAVSRNSRRVTFLLTGEMLRAAASGVKRTCVSVAPIKGPELQSLVRARRHDLPSIRTERDGVHRARMTHEGGDRLSRHDVPHTDRAILTGRRKQTSVCIER